MAYSEGNQAVVYSSVSVRDIHELVASMGWFAEIKSDRSGDPVIVCRVGDNVTQIIFYGLSGDSARSMTLQLRFADAAPFELLNHYNENKRFLKYYLQAGPTLIIEMDCSFGGGITIEHIRYLLEFWEGAVGKLFET